jgi:hypothetical protein
MPTDDNSIIVPAKKTLENVEDGTPTDVEDIMTPSLDVNAPMYDVLGRIVDKTYRGVVIQNGQAYLLY